MRAGQCMDMKGWQVSTWTLGHMVNMCYATVSLLSVQYNDNGTATIRLATVQAA